MVGQFRSIIEVEAHRQELLKEAERVRLVRLARGERKQPKQKIERREQERFAALRVANAER